MVHLVHVAHLSGAFAPLEFLPIAAALSARRARQAARGRSVPRWRRLCFAAGPGARLEARILSDAGRRREAVA